MNEKGQSTIEFILSFAFLVGFFVVFIQFTLNTGMGYLAHYATYMASRVFMVYDYNGQNPNGSDGPAQQEGRKEFQKYLNLGNPEFNTPSNPPSGQYLYTGAEYRFQKKLSLFSLMGGAVDLKMVSQSFLGKEPTRATCLERICEAMKAAGQAGGAGNACSLQGHVTLFDNGC